MVLEHFQWACNILGWDPRGQGSEGSGVRGNNRGTEGDILSEIDTWKAKVFFAVFAFQVADQYSVVERPPQHEDAQKPGSLRKERWEERYCALTKYLTTSVSTGGISPRRRQVSD